MRPLIVLFVTIKIAFASKLTTETLEVSGASDVCQAGEPNSDGRWERGASSEAVQPQRFPSLRRLHCDEQREDWGAEEHELAGRACRFAGAWRQGQG